MKKIKKTEFSTLKNVKDINKKQLEKQLKPTENGINNANTKACKKLKFFNRLGTDVK